MRTAICFTLAMTLAACGQGGEKSQPGALARNAAEVPQIDACELLKKAGAAGAISLAAPVSNDPHPTDVCTYYTTDAPERWTADLWVDRQLLAAAAKKLKANGEHVERVDGLGDGAFFSHESGIFVAKGPITLSLDVREEGDPAVGPKEMHVDLARVVLKYL